MQAAGYDLENPPITDGKLHRFPCGDRNGDRAGWYVLHGDGVPAGSYGDWRSGKSFTWCAKKEHDFTPQERETYRQRIEEQKRAREAEEKRTRDQAAERARKIWDAAKPASADHAYLKKKQVKPYGIRQDAEGRLLVPVRNPAGDINSLQTIDGDGKKLFLPGGQKRGCCCAIKGNGETYYVSEGYATGASIHEATGASVIVSFDAGNLLPAAEALRAKHPDAKITICGDDDRWTEGNPGRTKAAAAAQAIGAELVIPRFKDLGTKPTDFNDLAVLEGLRVVKEQVVKRPRSPLLPPARAELVISNSELNGSALSPPCIVRDYLFSDVSTVAAPGGTGKTTLMLYEIIHIALERALYGLDVLRPGWCLYVTAEDTREILIARLREIMQAMQLTANERQTVMKRALFWDVTGELVRLISAHDGIIELTALADNIVNAFQNDPPVLTVFDPAISFGAGESYVNDNEQGLIMAARRIVRGLGCCVRLVAHTGKLNARGKTLDQYTSRGGSALSDGARMVAVLQTWQPGDERKPPAECSLLPDSSITILARPKLSYAPANQPLIWIRRSGWEFEYFTEVAIADEDRDRALYDRVERLLHSEVVAGRRHSRNTFETGLPKDITRADARRAINHLMACGRIVEAELPKDQRQGGRKNYLTTSAKFGEVREKTPVNDITSPPPHLAAALRDFFGGEVPPAKIPDSLALAGEVRRSSAKLARLNEITDDEVDL